MYPKSAIIATFCAGALFGVVLGMVAVLVFGKCF